MRGPVKEVREDRHAIITNDLYQAVKMSGCAGQQSTHSRHALHIGLGRFYHFALGKGLPENTAPRGDAGSAVFREISIVNPSTIFVNEGPEVQILRLCPAGGKILARDRKSTRLNSSH